MLALTPAYGSASDDIQEEARRVAVLPPENPQTGYFSGLISYFNQLLEALNKDEDPDDPYVLDIYAVMLTGF